jgi:hypothetical protein
MFVAGVPAIQSATENLATASGTRFVTAGAFSVDTIRLSDVFPERFDAMLYLVAQSGQSSTISRLTVRRRTIATTPS